MNSLKFAFLALALALAACSSPAGAPETRELPDAEAPAQDAGATTPDASSPDASDAAPQATSYAKGRVTVDAEGVATDHTLGTAGVRCAFEKASDGVVRCLPTTSGVEVAGFTFSICENQLFSAPAGTTEVYVSQLGQTCYSTKAETEADVYELDLYGACSAATRHVTGNFFGCDVIVPPSGFVSVTEADR